MSEKKRKATPVEEAIAAQHTSEMPRPGAFTAKKDFEIHHNGYDRKIQVGDDLSEVPEMFHPNLRAEGVL